MVVWGVKQKTPHFSTYLKGCIFADSADCESYLGIVNHGKSLQQMSHICDKVGTKDVTWVSAVLKSWSHFEETKKIHNLITLQTLQIFSRGKLAFAIITKSHRSPAHEERNINPVSVWNAAAQDCAISSHWGYAEAAPGCEHASEQTACVRADCSTGEHAARDTGTSPQILPPTEKFHHLPVALETAP